MSAFKGNLTECNRQIQGGLTNLQLNRGSLRKILCSVLLAVVWLWMSLSGTDVQAVIHDQVAICPDIVNTINNMTASGLTGAGQAIPLTEDNAALTINPCTYDFGDLPDDDHPSGSPTSPGYNTDILSSNLAGPSHLIRPDLILGTIVDAEPIAQPHPDAMGDDITDAIDDEDGITMGIPIAGRNLSMQATVLNATGAGASLKIFIDWNGDADFADVDETVTLAIPSSIDPQLISQSLTVPAEAITNHSIGARFRLSTDPSIGPDGAAPDGEVEDYLLSVQPLNVLIGRVFVDNNGNGIQEGNEPGLAGVTVQVTDSYGVRIPVVTDTNGDYRVQVPAGDATVDVDESTLPPDYTQTAGSDPSQVSVLNGSVADAGADGFRPRSSTLGDRVWHDINRNGQQDPGEQGLNGVTLILQNSNGNQLVATTSGDGSYLFQELSPDRYTISVDMATVPTDFVLTSATGLFEINLVENQSFMDADFGLDVAMTTIGDRLWYDSDYDGSAATGTIQPISEHLVQAVAEDGSIYSAYTDINGFYTIWVPVNKRYTVTTEVPAGMVPVPVLVNTGDKPAENNDRNHDHAGTTVVIAEEANHSIDFGFTVIHTEYQDSGVDMGIGPMVSIEVEKLTNGHDADTSGGPQVAVGESITWTYIVTNSGDITLTHIALVDDREGPISCPQTTLSPGANTVCQHYGIAQSDYVNTAVVSGTLSIDSSIVVTDSDTSRYQVIGLSLGNLVWHDRNKNGLYEPDKAEEGIDGVTIELYPSGATPGESDPISTTVTHDGGRYVFDKLALGSYFIYISKPPTLYPQSSVATSESDDHVDNDDNGLQDSLGEPVRSPDIMLTRGNEPVNDGDDANGDQTVDVGFYAPTVAIGSQVWFDLDFNGIQDAGEPGVSNVTVNLYQVGVIEPIATRVTDENGHYLFAALPAGNYYVIFDIETLPVRTMPTLVDRGDDAKDSDANRSTGGTLVINAHEATTYRFDIDMGIVPTASLGDRVWYDHDQDGIQDANEGGVSGIEVQIYNSANDRVASTKTDGSGRYFFDGLPVGDYQVQFIVPSEYQLSQANVDSGDVFDSDPDENGRTSKITLETGEHDSSVDAGIFLRNTSPSSIGDRVWYDANRDGIQDSNESGIPGVSVLLLDGNANEVARTVTNKDGRYLFENLIASTYAIEFIAPTDHLPSPADVGSNANSADQLDSDMDPSSLKTALITLQEGTADATWDAGFYTLSPPGAIGDYVWFDLNQNGIQDGDENGIPGMAVTLLDENGIELTTLQTDADGRYLFNNLPMGKYYVRFNPSSGIFVPSMSDQGLDDRVDSDQSTQDLTTPLITLSESEHNYMIDAGFYFGVEEGASTAIRPVAIGDKIWIDSNADGLNNDEPEPVPSVTVSLYTAAGDLVATTETDQSGSYLFSNLVPGDYYVEFMIPNEYSISKLNVDRSADENLDSDVDPESGRTTIVTLSAGVQNLMLDLGIYTIQPLSLDAIDEPEASEPEAEDPVQQLYVPMFQGRSGIGNKMRQADLDEIKAAAADPSQLPAELPIDIADDSNEDGHGRSIDDPSQLPVNDDVPDSREPASSGNMAADVNEVEQVPSINDPSQLPAGVQPGRSKGATPSIDALSEGGSGGETMPINDPSQLPAEGLPSQIGDKASSMNAVGEDEPRRERIPVNDPGQLPAKVHPDRSKKSVSAANVASRPNTNEMTVPINDPSQLPAEAQTDQSTGTSAADDGDQTETDEESIPINDPSQLPDDSTHYPMKADDRSADPGKVEDAVETTQTIDDPSQLPQSALIPGVEEAGESHHQVLEENSSTETQFINDPSQLPATPLRLEDEISAVQNESNPIVETLPLSSEASSLHLRHPTDANMRKEEEVEPTHAIFVPIRHG